MGFYELFPIFVKHSVQPRLKGCRHTTDFCLPLMGLRWSRHGGPAKWWSLTVDGMMDGMGIKLTSTRTPGARHVFSAHLYTKIVILHNATSSCLHHAYTVTTRKNIYLKF